MEKTRSKLTKQGLLAALAPCLNVGFQGLLFWLIWRGPLHPRASAYLTLTGVGAILSAIFAACCLPELTNRRGALLVGPRRDDRRWLVWFTLLNSLLLPTAAAAELFIFQAAAFGEEWFFLGLTLYAASWFLQHWAMLHNRFFVIGTVLPGEDATDLAVTGPYRLVRHPGYLAMLLHSLAPVWLLGSLASLLPALGLLLLIVFRTLRKDRFLSQQLNSYDDYGLQVKQRLLPGIW
jgi:protein-S-isoprenylcysteine O-methyltransferase Ste14